MKISIVMVCMNAAPVIRGALESVRAQRYRATELVVIDGGSSDGTQRIVTEYLGENDVFVSEPDSGIYNAMNKGISRCTGEIIYFLNADDRLHDAGVLDKVMASFARTDADLVYGDVEMRPNGGGDYTIRYPHRLSRRFLARHTICHQALFARRGVFERAGTFDESFALVADYLWILQCFFDHGMKFRHAGIVVASVDGRGVSYRSDALEPERQRAMQGYYSWMERKLWREWPVRYARQLGLVRWYTRRIGSLFGIGDG